MMQSNGHNSGKLAYNDIIVLGDGAKSCVLKVCDISSIEVTGGNYMSVKKTDGESVTTRGSLARCEKRLPWQFFRASRQQMINLADVSKANLSFRKIILIMRGGDSVSLSRIQSKLFRKQYCF